ncbi:MAG TPA: hypothetical protein VN025_05305 [Candidatus Dormibacteraeota bacterium]|nr:hypothetical protein [Candidatus Dormibacteraeota bacterium]
MARTAKIGDVFEVATSTGLAYFQCTYKDEGGFYLIRVLPGFFSVRPADIRSLVNERELYFTFYFLRSALWNKKITFVSSEQVPEWAKSVILRHPVGWDPTGKTDPWILRTPEQRLTTDFLGKAVRYPLTPEIEKLSMDGIWPHEVFVEHLVKGWRPELDAEFMEKAIEEGRALRAKFPKQDTKDERMRYYLYFKTKARADGAKDFFFDRGFAAEVRRPSGETKEWLTVAFGTCPPDAVEGLRDAMRTLAEKQDGRYAGSEVALPTDPINRRMDRMKSPSRNGRKRLQ